MSEDYENSNHLVGKLPQDELKMTSSTTYESTDAVTASKKLKSKPTSKRLNDDNSPAVIAMSNLRCPSPPPILQHPAFPSQAHQSVRPSAKEGEPFSGATSNSSQQDSVDSLPPSDTASPAVDSSVGRNGALGVGGSAKFQEQGLNVSRLTESLRKTSAKHEGPRSNSPIVRHEEDDILAMPAPQHQRTTSMHAHFSVEDIMKHPNARSRSGSASTNDLEAPHHIVPPLPQIKPNEIAHPATSVPTTSTDVHLRLPQDDGKLHILFGACGSVSIKKTRLIINKLEQIYKDNVSIQLILTKAAEHFVSRGEFPANVQIWRDKDEWSVWNSRTDPVLHIELRRWADVLIIAPLSANTMSKIAMGLCDNLLTNVVRAWNTQYPIILAPAMVSFAYTSPVTKRHAKTIKEDMKWIEILKPTEKVVSSYGEIGMGGMMDWNEIVDKIVQKLGGYPEDEDDEDDEGEEDVKRGEDEEDEGDEEDEEKDEEEEEDDDDDDDDGENAGESGEQNEPPLISGIRKLTVAEEDELSEAIEKGKYSGSSNNKIIQ
ncbi:hypothetical protein KL921_003904 [Ogataea angusta]|uniref:Flavoprotein domain-containing protein n=1 Tax=Pichia angusta TaxID=870730 RepID=A0AAN6I4Y4_PICAN|nr:uncharacterized protein KL928_004145 [Ogataea angusta]KAG7808822.1 hypothetical protein KL921_003904 [Ogataea angusta]KAG7817410.1 hypothetical protein KL928_004145 [Ogataea angusta]KAG7828914.1 hypothetical protein KL920_003410 [Ogataea angusta]KAG7839105.1 hypothetical protein KL942_003467 [Ogataea angusta]KAG7844643.1 hypothetical protein KL941_003383 [Ogataea angusta]